MRVDVGEAADVPEGETRRFDVGGRRIAVVNLGGGGFRAIDDECSHAQYYLSEGEVDVEDETIECPKHGSTFDLNTGKPTTLPATQPVAVYPLEMAGGRILIDVQESTEE